MPRFAANLTMLFTEYPFLERFGRARAAGFNAVEFLFPYDHDVDAISAELERHDLTQILFNLPAGDFAGGERGVANDPRRIDEFRDGVQQALTIAPKLGVNSLNCLVGLTLTDVSLEEQRQTLIENLRFAAEATQVAGIIQFIEPLNTIDTPDYLLATARQGVDLLDRIGHDNLKLQFDVYHEQRMSGNLTATLKSLMDRIGHIQIADSPDRQQPGSGEINYPYLLKVIDASGYDGWVSLEYNPEPDTDSSFGWLSEYDFA